MSWFEAAAVFQGAPACSELCHFACFNSLDFRRFTAWHYLWCAHDSRACRRGQQQPLWMAIPKHGSLPAHLPDLLHWLSLLQSDMPHVRLHGQPFCVHNFKHGTAACQRICLVGGSKSLSQLHGTASLLGCLCRSPVTTLPTKMTARRHALSPQTLDATGLLRS